MNPIREFDVLDSNPIRVGEILEQSLYVLFMLLVIIIITSQHRRHWCYAFNAYIITYWRNAAVDQMESGCRFGLVIHVLHENWKQMVLYYNNSVVSMSE